MCLGEPVFLTPCYRIAQIRSASETKRATWEHDLAFAKEQELAWLLRWVLSRIQRVKESTKEVEHGVMEWEVYEEWRGRERGEFYSSADGG